MRHAWVLGLAFLTPLAQAAWEVVPANSSVSYVSVKREGVLDIHTISSPTGTVSEKGEVRVLLPFSNLDSGLALRDERQREVLFEAQVYPQAELSATVDLADWKALAAGQSKLYTLDFKLDLHGQSQPLKADVLVSRLAENKVLVVTTKPLILKAENFDLLGGLDKLKELAGLPSIGTEVPVTAVLEFVDKP